METSQLQNCVFSTLAQYRQRFAHICGGMAASSSPSPADGQMGNRCVPAHLSLQLQNRNKTHRTIAMTWIPYLIFCFDLTLQKTFKYNFTALKKKSTDFQIYLLSFHVQLFVAHSDLCFKLQAHWAK